MLDSYRGRLKFKTYHLYKDAILQKRKLVTSLQT